MKQNILNLLILSTLFILVLGTYAVMKEINTHNATSPQEHQISEQTMYLLQSMSNDDVDWTFSIGGITPELNGATLLLARVEEEIDPFLIEMLLDENKFVSAHILLSFRSSRGFYGGEYDWNGLKLEFRENEVSYEENNLHSLQQMWKDEMLGASSPRFAPLKQSLHGDPSCSWPCWHKITPGVTTSDEALFVLQKSPLIQQDHLRVNENEEFGYAYWDWSSGKYQIAQSRIIWRGGVVHDIILLTDFVLTVEEVIGRFGEPEKVSITSMKTVTNRAWYLTLYYTEKGFEIVMVFPEDTDTIFDSSQEITGLYLFEPTLIVERISYLSLYIEDINLLPWKGYGNIFDLYVR